MITPRQIRAARVLLGWKQSELAEASGLSVPTIQGIEAGKTDARGSTLGKIQSALETAGVEIIPAEHVSMAGGEGVRLKSR